MTKMHILDLFIQQLGKSNMLKILVLILVASSVGRILVETWYFDYPMFASGYFLLFMVSIAMLTAIHEGTHVTKLQELGFTMDDFAIHRIGDVSFRIKEIEKMTMEQRYQIAKDPYRIPNLTLESVSLFFLLIIGWYSPFPLSILLLLVTAFACSHLVADFCVSFVIWKKKKAGFSVSFSRKLASRGDIDDIVSWNNQLRDKKEEIPR